ncbi:MAG: hypothetical protein HY471_00655 [Candidatus Sungbacteria bacterium]|nr:hypothetical protein [Candidatus Sungbacteria bacterium]
MIYFLYGRDTYRSRQKLREIVLAYRKKNEGTFDLQRFLADRDDPMALSQVGKAQSLFLKKKLIVIERPSEGDEPAAKALKTFLRETGSDTNIFVVIWDDKGEKDGIGEIKKIVGPHAEKIVEYAPMTVLEAERWLGIFLEERALKLPESMRAALVAAYGGDTWKLANETEKVALGGEMAALLGETEERIFSLTDAFLADTANALRALQRVRRSGMSDFLIFASVVGHLRALLMVADGENKALHPFVVKKAKEKLKTIGIPRIKDAYERFFDEDKKIKLGLSDPHTSLVNLILFS